MSLTRLIVIDKPKRRAAECEPARALPNSADVARIVGVSRATVSYVLNGLPNSRISAEIQESVRDAANTLGYIPHAMASFLRKGHTNTVLIPQYSYPLSATLTMMSAMSAN